MKRFVVLLSIFLFLFITCKKENKDDLNTLIDNSDVNVKKSKIDFDKLKSLISSSSSIDLDVFFAISVCHKEYISKFQDAANKLDEDDQKLFYQEKKSDFFNSIKYTEEQYDDFMEKNGDKMNEYILNHQDIADYLISTN